VIEEMLHMALVGNLINAIGGAPNLTVPQYPGYIPHHAAGGPFIQLQPLSAALARVVFMAIEQPELDPEAPAEGDDFATVGQFYKAIEEGFAYCDREVPELFRDTGRQRTDTYFGGGGGQLIHISNLESARLALREITEQGEGAPLEHPPYPGEESFGSLDNYGTRTDGTYGPILGTPWEMSHYGKFKQIATGEVAIAPTYPMQANPSAEDLDGAVLQLSQLFDACYTASSTGSRRRSRRPMRTRPSSGWRSRSCSSYCPAWPPCSCRRRCAKAPTRSSAPTPGPGSWSPTRPWLPTRSPRARGRWSAGGPSSDTTTRSRGTRRSMP
jgi:hypothetical protein